MAQHLRPEAILTVPPSLPLTLIITVFQPISLKMSSSREDVAAVVVRNIRGCKAECARPLSSCTQPPLKKKPTTQKNPTKKQTSVNQRVGKRHRALRPCWLDDLGALEGKQDETHTKKHWFTSR